MAREKYAPTFAEDLCNKTATRAATPKRGRCDWLGVGARVRSQLIERNRTSNPRMHRQNKWLASHTAVDRISCSGMRTSASALALSTISFLPPLSTWTQARYKVRPRVRALESARFYGVSLDNAVKSRPPRLSPANRKRVGEYTKNAPAGSFGPEQPPSRY